MHTKTRPASHLCRCGPPAFRINAAVGTDNGRERWAECSGDRERAGGRASAVSERGAAGRDHVSAALVVAVQERSDTTLMHTC